MNKVDNLSLFDEYDIENNIDVVQANYIDYERTNWKDLFSGFDKMYAITYSSGIGFINKLMQELECAEIIFGCEEVMSYSLHEIMSFQNVLIERIRDTISQTKSDLIDRIVEGSLHLYVAREKLSHEKMYLLESKEGRKRVITGSANMSYKAFTGTQRENIICFDDEDAFNYYFNVYSLLKIKSVDNISHKAILSADITGNIDKLPISEKVEAVKLIEVVSNKEQQEEIKYSLDVQKGAKNLETAMPKKDKLGKIYLTTNTVKDIRQRRLADVEKEKNDQSVYPKLIIDVNKKEFLLNDEVMDLYPQKEEVVKDIQLFKEYMNGFEKFHGNTRDMQMRYFELANWFFCSPFMAIMRDTAYRFNYNILPYPTFGLVYGQSKAGKTTFLETLLKMMIGQKTKMSAPDFTRSSIESLKRTVQGAPIIVDDLTNTRFNQHAVEMIKNDDFGVADRLFYYPAVVISANDDVKAVPPEISRRTVVFHVSAGLTNTEMMESNIVRNVQNKIGTAFYREYIRRMLEIVPDLINELKGDSSIIPDILKYSSEVITDIFNNYKEELPFYIRFLSLSDYFGEKVTGAQAIKIITNSWDIDKKLFSINKKKNELVYDAKQTYEADRLIKQLPETLEAKKIGDKVVMKLDEATKYFDVKFKKNFWNK